MQVEDLDALPVDGSQRFRLRSLHGFQHRIQQIERNHHQYLGQWIKALQFPGNPGRMTFEIKGRGLRINAVGLNVFPVAKAPNGVTVWIKIFQVRTLANIRIYKENLCADLLSAPDAFDKRIGDLYRNINGAILLSLLVKDNRKFGKTPDGTQIG